MRKEVLVLHYGHYWWTIQSIPMSNYSFRMRMQFNLSWDCVVAMIDIVMICIAGMIVKRLGIDW